MPFIEVKDDKYSIDDYFWNEEPLIETFIELISKRGFDKLQIVCGVNPSPDFGYFELGDRFWRASLCIYFIGATSGFVERGAGYSEPWLFNARHAIELYIKGQILFTVWFEKLHDDTLSSGYVRKIKNLRKNFDKPHGLYELYQKYKQVLRKVIKGWNSDELGETPDIKSLLLSHECEELLKELDEADKKSFRFRYPSFDKEKVECLHEIGWHHKDKDKDLFIKTGLPKSPGCFFDHIKVINSLHALMKELRSISLYMGGCWDYIGEMQDILSDLMREFESDFS